MTEYEVTQDTGPVEKDSAEDVLERAEVKPKEDVVDAGTDIEKAEYNVLAKEAMDSYLNKALEMADMPKNEENYNKALSKLVEKINKWVDEGDFELDLSQQLNTEKDIKKALLRRDLEYTARNIRDLIEEIEETQ